MATKQIGKLKLHWSKRGIAFKWGDGDIHRLSFERNETPSAGGYADQGYGAAPYDEQGYDQGGYDGAQYNQDYYGQAPHDGGRYAFLYSNDYLMYALLVLLPPLGIWILWKRERFTPMVRGIVSAVSGIWFVLLLIWLFTALLGGGQDPIQQTGNKPLPSPTAPIVAPATPAPSEGPDITVPGAPTATPRAGTGTETNPLEQGNPGSPSTPGTTGGNISANDICYFTATGQYYHAKQDCPDLGANATRSTVGMARSRSLTPCPLCYPAVTNPSTPGTTASQSSVLYATERGKNYHVDPNCGGMKDAKVITLVQAKKLGKTPCDVCIGKYYATDTGQYYHTDRNCSGMSGAHLITAKAAEAAGKTKCPKCLARAQAKTATTSSATFYSTAKGKYYHKDKTCQGMKGATKVTAAIIKKRGQTPCPVCIGSTAKAGSKEYYATRTGTYYHTKSDCSGMKGATKISLATAKKFGKKACPKCVATAAGTGTATGAATYYATSAGKYYHKTSTCSGMKDAKKVTKAAAEKNGKTACPVCLKDMTTYVYGTSSGKYYHKNSSCSGMKGAKRMTLAAAKTAGKTACPTCYKSAAAKDATYFMTSSGKYYHVKATCSGMKNASRVTLATAKARGKTACPVCLGKPATTYYYATSKGEYYHTKSNCSGMSGASKITLAAAQSAGKNPCPVCVKKAGAPSPTPQVNKVYCYASSGSKYYHKVQGCSDLKNLKKVLLSAARAKGKTACPVCVTKTVKTSNLTTSYADKQTTCYASTASAYYHGDKDCVSGLSRTTVSAAKGKGKTACPSCGRNLNTYVYVTRSGTKYHRKSTCAGTANAYKISLNTALSRNYVRCTKCNAPKKQ